MRDVAPSGRKARCNRQLRSFLACATIAMALGLMPAAHADLVVPSGAQFATGGGQINLACTDVIVAGTLFVASGGLVNVRHLTILPGGTIDGGSGVIQLGGNWSNGEAFAAGTSTVRFVDSCGIASVTVGGSTAFFNARFVSTTGYRRPERTTCSRSVRGGLARAELGGVLDGARLHRVCSRAMAARMVEKVIRHSKIAEGWFGSSNVLGAAEEYGFSVVGLDLRPQAVDLMRQYGIEAHVMELETYRPELPPQVISMADVLEHMPFAIPELEATHNLLAQEGLLFLSMPNSDCYAWRMLDRLEGNPFWGELEHYHNFGKQRLYALLRQQGFEPIDYGINERYYMCMEVIARKLT